MNDANPEQELRNLVAERVAAVRAKDAEALAARQADDIVIYDVLPPLKSQGRDAGVDKTQAWFDNYASDIDYQVHDLNVAADDQLGFCSFLYHVGGTLNSGDAVDMWGRATLCCIRLDGQWRIVHDHESVPFDPETGQALVSLQP